MFCSKCGNILDSDGTFCRYCGVKITRIQIPDTSVLPPPAVAYPDRNVPDVRVPVFPGDKTENPRPTAPEITSPFPPVTAAAPVFTAGIAPNVGVAPEEASLFPENEPVAEPQMASFSVQPVGADEAEPIIGEFTGDERNGFVKQTEAFESIPEPAFSPEAAETPRGAAAKEYFGKPALIFCLVVIGLLSVACGVLSTLYFGLV